MEGRKEGRKGGGKEGKNEEGRTEEMEGKERGREGGRKEEKHNGILSLSTPLPDSSLQAKESPKQLR